MRNECDITQYDIIRQLRVPMITLVVFAHSYSHVAEDFNLLTSDWNTYEFLKLLVSQTLAKVAVPVFFIISGYLYFSNVKEWNLIVYCQKIQRRVKTLLIPYLICNLLMALKLKAFSWSFFWNYFHESGKQIDWFGTEHYLVTPANMPLWFLRDLIIVSLLTPFIYMGVRKLNFWLIIMLTILYLSGVCPFIPGLSAYSIYFFTLGAYIGIRKQNFIETFMHVEVPAYFLSIILGIAMLFTYHTTVFSSLMLTFRITGAVAVFCLARHFATKSSSLVFDSAYFIYLVHYIVFLCFIDEAYFAFFGTSELCLCIHYIFAPLLKVSLFIIIFMIYKFFRNMITNMICNT